MYKFYTFLSLIIFFCTTNYISSQSIDSSLFSHNAWYFDKDETDTLVFSDTLDAQLPSLASIGVKFVRIGGIGVNFKPLYSWNNTTFTITADSQVVRLKHLIDTIRACGMEPIIQVGYKPANICTTLTPFLQISQADQATIAGNLVKYLNNPDSGSLQNQATHALDYSQ